MGEVLLLPFAAGTSDCESVPSVVIYMPFNNFPLDCVLRANPLVAYLWFVGPGFTIQLKPASYDGTSSLPAAVDKLGDKHLRTSGMQSL